MKNRGGATQNPHSFLLRSALASWWQILMRFLAALGMITLKGNVLHLLNSDKNVQVSDTTAAQSKRRGW